MKTLSVAWMLVAISASPALADAGFAVSSDLHDGAGSIYSPIENRDISMDEEVIRFLGGTEPRIEVTFLFTNTSGKDLTVDAAFPVRISFKAPEEAPPVGGAGAAGDRLLAFAYADQSAASTAHRLTVVVSHLGEGAIRLRDAGRATVDPFQGKPDYGTPGTFFVAKRATSDRRMVPAGQFADPYGFAIAQDGTKIVPDSAILESRLAPDGKALDLFWHYHFRLATKAHASSVLRVSYSPEYVQTFSQGSMDSVSFATSYILGTGRTWRGPIGKLILLVPTGAKVEAPKSIVPIGATVNEDAYLASGYEPAEADELRVWYALTTAIHPNHRGFASDPPADVVTVRGASSFLPGTTNVTFEGGFGDSTYEPARAFDGSRAGGWVEGAAGDGVGEWIEADLLRDVTGIAVQNGFTEDTATLYRGGNQTFRERNRVQNLEIASADGKVRRTVTLGDTQELQYLRDVVLPKGRYRFTIRSVFKGTRGGETALGDISFFPTNAKIAALLRDDAFLRSVY